MSGCRRCASTVAGTASVTMQRPISLHGDLEDDPGMLRRPGKSEAKVEAEARCYEAEAERKL